MMDLKLLLPSPAPHDDDLPGLPASVIDALVTEIVIHPQDSAATLAPVGQFRRRPRRRIFASIAVVAAAVGGTLFIPTFFDGARPSANAEVVAVLSEAAAGAVTFQDEPLLPGQFRYIGAHVWGLMIDESYNQYLFEQVAAVWAPADLADTEQPWLLNWSVTGDYQWLLGDKEAFEAAGGVPASLLQGRQDAAPCGDFDGDLGCTRPGWWNHPTAEFLADLPREPQALHDRLAEASADHPRGDAQLLTNASDLLSSGLAPADLRAALYQALTMIPTLIVTDRVANLDGQRGTALGVDDNLTRDEIIIDPTTGQFIGHRSVLTTAADGLPAGTTLSFSSVEVSVVDSIGQSPE